MIKVAIIDDGVMPSHFFNTRVKLYSINDNLNVINCNDTQEPLESHATTCFKIIKKYCDCSEVEFYSIQILNQQTKQGNISKFIRALEFCLELNIDLIHLSIGTRCYNDFEKIKNCVESLTDKGIIIVAAQSNQGTITYPAYLPNVIGVKCDPKLRGDRYSFCKRPFDGINFSASSVHVLRENNAIQISPLSNSYAAPLITAKAINFLIKKPNSDISEVYTHLILKSMNSQKSNTIFIPKICKSIKNGIIFNISNDDQNPLSLMELKPEFTCEQYLLKSNDIKKIQGYISFNEKDWIVLNFNGEVYEKQKIIEYMLKSFNQNIAVFDNGKSISLDNIKSKEKKRLWLYENDNVLDCDIIISDVNCPVILFNGFEPNRLIKIVKKLSMLFTQKAYFCKVALDIPQAELFSFNVIPPNVSIANYIDYACSFFKCDILLLGQSQTFSVQECENISVLVRNEINRQNYNEYRCKETENVYISGEDENWLFNYINEMLL